MNLSNNPSEKVSKPSWRPYAFMATIALSVSSCISTQNNPHSFGEALQKDVINEGYNLDDPVFIALVGISAEVQVSMEYPENHSLQFVWETVSSRLKEINLKHDVSVSLCSPQLTERGFAYICIDVTGQQTQIFTKDQKTAKERTKGIQESYITYMVDRMHVILGENPATKEKLQMILQDEEKVLAKHLMTAIVQPDNDNQAWTISFEADAS